MPGRKRKIASWAAVGVVGLSLAYFAATGLRQQHKQPPPPPGSQVSALKQLDICSFNIQFLGQSHVRDDNALADLLKDYDIVVVQELIAPPYPMRFPDGSEAKPEPRALRFFDEMTKRRFAYKLSEEDTGTGDAIHLNSAATEWWVVFFKASAVRYCTDVPTGFLADDRSNNADYERVPYAFGFRTPDGHLDFVLISVHLMPGHLKKDRARRQHELGTIAAWVKTQNAKEKDFIVLGDMNIDDPQELVADVPEGFVSLNEKCQPTNTNVRDRRPYDHVLFNPKYSTEVDRRFGFRVIDLIEVMRSRWTSPGRFPGDPYDHDKFRQRYSDHNPVVFRLDIPDADDD